MKNNIITVLQKNAEKCKNRVIIPMFFIKKYGYEFYMEVYEDKLVIVPKNKG